MATCQHSEHCSININVIKNATDYSDAVTNKTLQEHCQHICNRHAEYCARNDTQLAEVSHCKLHRKRKVTLEHYFVETVSIN